MNSITALLPGFAVNPECPYRPVPEFEFRRADVAAVAKDRWEAAGDWLFCAPELVTKDLSVKHENAIGGACCALPDSRRSPVLDRGAEEKNGNGLSP